MRLSVSCHSVSRLTVWWFKTEKY